MYDDCFNSESKNKENSIDKISRKNNILRKLCSDFEEEKEDDIDKISRKNIVLKKLCNDFEEEENENIVLKKLCSDSQEKNENNSVLNEEKSSIKKPIITDNTQTSIISDKTLLYSMFVAISSVSKTISDILKEPTINDKESLIKDLSTSLTNILAKVNTTKEINNTKEITTTKEINSTKKEINTTKEINNTRKISTTKNSNTKNNTYTKTPKK